MGYRALVIDDNPVNTAVISGLLEKFQVKSVLASSGEETVNREDLDTFHIIFTDYLMPGMNGIQVGKEVHEKVKDKGVHIPVILCTANVGAAGQAADLEDGINYILTKPVKVGELEQVLKRYVDKDIKMVEKEVKDKQGEKLEIANLDTEYAIQQCGDREIYLSILKEFHRTIPRTCELLQWCEERNDTESYRVQVHGLRGASRLVGAMELARLCEFLENAVKSKTPRELHGQTEYMMRLYKGYSEALQPFVEKQEKDLERKVVSKELIKEKLQSMGSLLDDFEIQHAEELLEELKGYLLDEEYENMLSKLAECIAGIDYEGGISCVNEYLG